MRAWTLLVIAGGCGFRVSGGADPLDPDAAIDSVGATDAPIDPDAPDAPPAVTCLPRWLAGTVTVTSVQALTTVNSTAFDRDPTISTDELMLYFSSGRTGSLGGDVWVATRASATAPFGTPVLATQFNSGEDETRVSFTGNGLIAAIGSNRVGGAGGVDIWLATRATTSAPFGAPNRSGLGAVNDGDSQHDPFLSHDGLRLYLAPSTGTQHVAVATRASTSDDFSAPVTLINSGTGDADPSLSPDERILVFSSRQAPSQNADLWFTTRSSVTAAFGMQTLVTGANSSSDDGDGSLSTDGCRLYFGSNRSGGTGDYDLYVANIAP